MKDTDPRPPFPTRGAAAGSPGEPGHVATSMPVGIAASHPVYHTAGAAHLTSIGRAGEEKGDGQGDALDMETTLIILSGPPILARGTRGAESSPSRGGAAAIVGRRGADPARDRAAPAPGFGPTRPDGGGPTSWLPGRDPGGPWDRTRRPDSRVLSAQSLSSQEIAAILTRDYNPVHADIGRDHGGPLRIFEDCCTLA